MTFVRDIGWLLRLALLSSVLMALGLASLAFIASRHFVWWIRGSQTA